MGYMSRALQDLMFIMTFKINFIPIHGSLGKVY